MRLLHSPAPEPIDNDKFVVVYLLAGRLAFLAQDCGARIGDVCGVARVSAWPGSHAKLGTAEMPGAVRWSWRRGQLRLTDGFWRSR